MSRKKTSVREYTNKFIEGMNDGSINAQVLAEGLLCAMSESNVEDFAHSEGYFQYEEEEEDEEDEEDELNR